MPIKRRTIISIKKPKFLRKKIEKKPLVFKINKSIKFIIILLMLLFLEAFRNKKKIRLIPLKIFKDTMKRKSFDEFKPHKVFIEAHRGVNRQIFENTKESIELAIKYGLDSFETDLWLSKDNVGVLVHGKSSSDIRDSYNRNYKVIYTNWAQLSTARTKRGNLTMPKFEDIIKLTKNKIFMNLEIKDSRVDLVFPYIVQLLEKYDYFDQISISSFHHRYYNKIVEFNKNNKLGKKLSFGFLYGRGMKAKYLPFHAKNNSLNLYWRTITKEICDKAHANKMAVMAWFYMGENETYNIYKRLFDYGIDIICSNDPLKAKQFRDLYYNKKIKNLPK